MAATSIPDLGGFLAVILVRCNDSSLLVRQTATETTQALLYINQVLGNPDNPKPAQEIKLITDIRNRLDQASSDDRLVILRDMCSLLTAVVGTNELISLLSGLLAKGLLDSDLEAAQGSALIFKTLLWSKCSEMTIAVRPLLTGLLAAIKVLRVGEVVEIALAALRILAKVHFAAVVGQLLEAPVPVPREVTDCVTALVETGPADPSQAPVRPVGMEAEWDPVLAERTLAHYLDVINETPLEKDKPTPIVSCATACMASMLRVDSFPPLIEKHYAAILCTLLMRVGTASGVDGKKASSSIDACGAVRAFLECAPEEALLKRLDAAQVWPVLEGASYDDGMTTFTRCFSELHPGRKRALLQFLGKFYSQQSYTGQRIVATAMLAEFVNHASDDVQLLREVIKFLLPRVADKVDKVRKQALRGLGHLVTVWNAETAAMATSVLSSLTAAAEDADADVAAEAVLSLTRIAGVVSEQLIGPMLISICFRLRPAFDRKEVREHTCTHARDSPSSVDLYGLCVLILSLWLFFSPCSGQGPRWCVHFVRRPVSLRLSLERSGRWCSRQLHRPGPRVRADLRCAQQRRCGGCAQGRHRGLPFVGAAAGRELRAHPHGGHGRSAQLRRAGAAPVP